MTARQRVQLESWLIVEIVYQFTGDEIGRQQADLFDTPGFDAGRIESFLFLAVELKQGEYSRTQLAESTRAVNRLFKMPVIVLFRHGSTVTFGSVNRRAHKIDESKDVLKKVTLIKDIRSKHPHRAHVEILADLALSRILESGVSSFDELHAVWENVLDIEALNRRFYGELFGWFEWAVDTCRFPDDGAGDGGNERHVIRLITRLLFIWFMKEKQLIPEELFYEHFARQTLKHHAPDKTDYYRAVLQNLFFATLNTEIKQRAFSTKTPGFPRDFTKYRYRDLMTDPDGFIERLKRVPFVNGGLFDCLDDIASANADGHRIDAFTDDIATRGPNLDVPARLFLDREHGLFPLFRRYKFTVEENTPLDREVALDPELLGRVFENLLAAYNPETKESARKATGSYYTPRQVVDYMVTEALVEALASNTQPTIEGDEFWRERLRYLLDWEDAKADAGDFFEAEEKESLVQAIAGLRVLDPAVGSGAFPMGVLHSLTLALRRLDPANRHWEELQKENARMEAAAAIDTADRAARDEELLEVSRVFETYRDSDFGRKLYLMQNGIFGVDIQPIACQIAKLRFFISLVVEQEANDEPANNYGIRPLPNLETRFVAADTLLGLRAARQQVLRSDRVMGLEKRLRQVRERYFNARSQKGKMTLRGEDTKLRADLSGELEADFGPDDAREIAGWDPYDQNTRTGWFDPEWMFGVPDGFDVVIGNPPYIQLQKDGGRARKKYMNAGWETFASTGDVYQLFYERGCGLLKPGQGTLAYITSNSWLKAEYGRSLRRWFAERHTPLCLIEMGKDVFNAIVDTAVLIVRNGKGEPVICRAVDVDQASDDAFPPPGGDWGTLQPDRDRPWMALSSIERAVMEKMEAVGTPLKNWDISIYYGIKTGFNEAFIVDQATRDALVAEDPTSAELLKPILRGRDIARYRANWAGLWLIDTHNGYAGVPPIDADNYPAIKAHLDKFIARLRRRQDKGVTPYNLRNCAYHDHFNGAKLLWRDMADTGCFAYSDTMIFTNDKAFMMTGTNLKYLCAVLNSSATTWLVSKAGLTTGMGLAQWKKFVVETIPVVQPDSSTLANIEDAVENVLSMLEIGDTQAAREVDETVDRMVVDLYGLTSSEAKAMKFRVN
ncbi:MAG: Eco57I restriction-modification methylase domain-containing protein [Paracoccaceae bacterium]|nr:Eco57I restriction-modification methylase domain-containing protein [Paracoccaceae bacterium]